MFKFKKSRNTQEKTPQENITSPEKRTSDCRRVSFDTKYIGLGKCIDKRKSIRRKADQFDEEAYERICRERLGPGWL